MLIDMKLACMIYNAGYTAGHHDTVEGEFTDVHYTEVDTLHNDKVEELIEWFREQPQAVQTSALPNNTSAEEK